jgi:hypothetical protein
MDRVFFLSLALKQPEHLSLLLDGNYHTLEILGTDVLSYQVGMVFLQGSHAFRICSSKNDLLEVILLHESFA